MGELEYWLAFVGTWLLFAGPAYQSALELHEEEEARAHMDRMVADIQMPPEASVWWWLLPPVAIALQWRRRTHFQDVLQHSMNDEDWKVVDHYLSVARGWALVSLGAWFMFLKYAWDLAQHRGWSGVAYVGIVVVATFLAIGSAGAGGSVGSRKERSRQ